jgi:(S)-mandelate dehydrogenase
VTLEHAACIDDLRRMARRRVPRFAFDLLDGGAEDESNLRRNTDAFTAIRLTPRYLVDSSAPSLVTKLFGRTYAVPFGMAPIGLLNVVWPDADLVLARLAARRNLPIVASAAASTTLEKIAEAAEGCAWFQLYASANADITEGLLRRAEAAGYEILVVTVDVPTPGKRDRDIRNGLKIPFRITPRVAMDLALHPRWCFATLAAGRPTVANYDDLLRDAESMAAVQATLISASFDWNNLKALRSRWKGRLLVKGILHPEDAVGCVELGCDGLVVSNHGGRQVAYGPASIEALPAVAAAVAGKVPLLIDSGIRRGADIVRAKALGADFALLGRAFGFGVGAGGAAGADRAFDIVTLELTRTLAQLGRPAFVSVDASIVAA